MNRKIPLGNESTKMVVVLVIVSLLSATALSIVYEKTKPTIEENKQNELMSSLKEVMSNAYRFEENNEFNLISEEREGVKRMFDAYDEEGNIIGEVLVIDAMGFGGTIKILVGMNLPYRKITGTKILDHLETPGLGERITEREFLDQFKDMSAQRTTYVLDGITGATMPAETVMKDEGIDAITGATISSTAVIKAVTENINKISAEIIHELPDEKNQSLNSMDVKNASN